MTHPRTAIRAAAKAQLVARLPSSYLGKVFASRAIPVRPMELPAIGIYANKEDVLPESYESNPRELSRKLDLMIECIASGPDIDQLLDTCCEHVEAALAFDVTLGGTVVECQLMGTEIDISDDGARLSGVATLQYSCLYYGWAEPIDGVLTWFKRAGVTWDLAGEQATLDEHQTLITTEAPIP